MLLYSKGDLIGTDCDDVVPEMLSLTAVCTMMFLIRKMLARENNFGLGQDFTAEHADCSIVLTGPVGNLLALSTDPV